MLVMIAALALGNFIGGSLKNQGPFMLLISLFAASSVAKGLIVCMFKLKRVGREWEHSLDSGGIGRDFLKGYYIKAFTTTLLTLMMIPILLLLFP
ncbi:unnamed protein product [Cuscuta campestris]|uniref:Uncharacterized protein n=1 Tax=Cuscuta campestris TaxID=132261 RepID=A0A484NEK6_9ASTE|nr:unnamed protein product [Cuscuta campestris]